MMAEGLIAAPKTGAVSYVVGDHVFVSMDFDLFCLRFRNEV